MTDLSKKSAIVYDYGLFTEMAAALKRTGFGTVYYFVPWQDAFPSSEKQRIGMDFRGLVRVQNFWDYVDKVDTIVCFDTYCGDLVHYLREQGYDAWGPGKAEEMELNRWKMRLMQKEVGLPVQATVRLKSIEDVELYFKGIKREVEEQFGAADESIIEKRLDEVLKKYDHFGPDYAAGVKPEQVMEEFLYGAEKKFVKSNMRGDIETFYAPNYEDSLSKFTALSSQLGHRFNTKEVEFVIEEKKEGIEPGFDGIQVNGEYLSPTMWGFEIDGGVYFGRLGPYKEIPEVMKEMNAKLSLLLKRYAPTSSFISTEFILTPDGKAYLIDPCVRNPAPVGSAIFSQCITNLAEVVYFGAQGTRIAPKFLPYKYAGGVGFDSSWAEDHELEVSYPEKISDYVKFRSAYEKEGRTFAVSGFSSIGSVTVYGNSVEEIAKKIESNAGEVKGYKLNVSTGSVKDALEEIKKLKEVKSKEPIRF